MHNRNHYIGCNIVLLFCNSFRQLGSKSPFASGASQHLSLITDGVDDRPCLSLYQYLRFLRIPQTAFAALIRTLFAGLQSLVRTQYDLCSRKVICREATVTRPLFLLNRLCAGFFSISCRRTQPCASSLSFARPLRSLGWSSAADGFSCF
jgi:hypothetical protein